MYKPFPLSPEQQVQFDYLLSRNFSEEGAYLAMFPPLYGRQPEPTVMSNVSNTNIAPNG